MVVEEEGRVELNRGVKFLRQLRAKVRVERGKGGRATATQSISDVTEEDLEARKLYMLRMYSESGRPLSLGDRAYFKQKTHSNKYPGSRAQELPLMASSGGSRMILFRVRLQGSFLGPPVPLLQLTGLGIRARQRREAGSPSPSRPLSPHHGISSETCL